MSSAIRKYKPLPVEGGWQVWVWEEVYREDRTPRHPAFKFEPVRPIDGAKIYRQRQAAYRKAKKMNDAISPVSGGKARTMYTFTYEFASGQIETHEISESSLEYEIQFANQQKNAPHKEGEDFIVDFSYKEIDQRAAYTDALRTLKWD